MTRTPEPGHILRAQAGASACALLALLLGAAGASAQVADTIPKDSVIVPIPAEALQDDTVPDLGEGTDSIFPAPALPEYPESASTGWASSRWRWSQPELARYHALSLLDLLERVPGLVVTHSGGFGRPAGLSAFGMGGGRVRVFVDGYELDPLASATFDLQHFGLADLGSLTVERNLNEVRVEISTFDLSDSRPFSRIGFGAGNYDAKLLRALFARPVGDRNILSAAFSVASTRGVGIAEPFTRKSGSAGWSYLPSEDYGLKLQYRFTGVERRSNADRTPQIFDENFTRQELVLRGRARLLDDLTVETILGRSWRAHADSTSFVDEDLASSHAAVRAAFQKGSGWLDASARLRSGSRRGVTSPGFDIALEAGVRPLPWLSAEGEIRNGRAGGVAGTDLTGTLTLGSWWGVSIFGTIATGTRGLGLIRDSTFIVQREIERRVDGVTVVDTVEVDSVAYSYPTVASGSGGLRMGAQWSAGDATAGVALLSLGSGRVVPFRLPFDADVATREVGAANGVESYISVPLVLEGLRLEGSYSRWFQVGSRPYLPTESGRLALVFHDVYFDGEFEPTLRIEGFHRGSAIVPNADGTAFDAFSNGYNLLNARIEFRIQDVQAYIGWENLLNDLEARDLPQFAPRVPRMMYGVSWDFRN